MAMSYHKVFRVPLWIVLENLSKDATKRVTGWLNGAEVLKVDWPAKSFPKALLEYRNKGYAHALPEYPFIVDSALLMRAASEHVKNVISPTSYLAGSTSVPLHRIDRSAKSDDDLVTIFNDILSLEEPIALSQIFQVQERCFREGSTQYKAWASFGPGVPKALLTRIAENVITVGEGGVYDVNLTDLKKDEINQKLEEFFSQIKL